MSRIEQALARAASPIGRAPNGLDFAPDIHPMLPIRLEDFAAEAYSDTDSPPAVHSAQREIAASVPDAPVSFQPSGHSSQPPGHASAASDPAPAAHQARFPRAGETDWNAKLREDIEQLRRRLDASTNPP